MKELPILFSTDMVQAIVAGNKTQTRRVITANNTVGFSTKKKLLDFSRIYPNGNLGVKVKEIISEALWRGVCKYQPGDLLYVKEIWINNVENCMNEFDVVDVDEPSIRFRANPDDDSIVKDREWKWKPSIHMPKQIARIWLEVTDVQVERVQDISEADAMAEGVDSVESFRILWDSINSKRGFGWNENLPVWAIEFKAISTTGRDGK